MRYQIQEMLRIEKIFEEEGIQASSMPTTHSFPDGTNQATILIEYDDVAERRRALSRLRNERARSSRSRARRASTRDRRRGSRSRDRRENVGRALPALRARAGDDRRGQGRRGALGVGVDHPAYQATVAASGRRRTQHSLTSSSATGA